jgi:O-antigen/teichoic acid export membrane protein
MTVVSSGIGTVVPLALIPISLTYLGENLYGLWMAVTAVTGMAGFADLGLGHGLMTKLAHCYSTGDLQNARRYIGSAYIVLTTVAVCCCTLLLTLGRNVPWSSLLSADGSVAASDATAVALVCLTVFFANIPLSLVRRVQYAYQQVAQSNMWLMAGTVSSLPLVLVVIHAGLPPVVMIATAVAGPVLGNLANSVWMYVWRMPELAPWRGTVGRRAIRELLHLGGLFLALTIVMTVATNADTLIVSHASDLRTVAVYAVAVKLFAHVGSLIALTNVPAWPASGDALVQGNVSWIRRATRRMTLLSVGLVVMCSAALLVGCNVILEWLNQPLSISQWLLAGLAAWWLLLASISPRFMVQNAGGVLVPQLVGWSLYLILSIPLKWLAAVHLGYIAIPYVATVLYSATVLPSALHGYRRTIAGVLPSAERFGTT